MGRTCDARAQLCTDTASSQMASGAPAAYQVRHEEEGGGDVKAEHGDEALEQAQLVACSRCAATVHRNQFYRIKTAKQPAQSPPST